MTPPTTYRAIVLEALRNAERLSARGFVLKVGDDFDTVGSAKLAAEFKKAMDETFFGGFSPAKIGSGDMFRVTIEHYRGDKIADVDTIPPAPLGKRSNTFYFVGDAP